MNKQKALMNKRDAWLCAQKIEYKVKNMVRVEFADTDIAPPEISFYPDSEQFFNPANNAIHLGSEGILELGECEDESEFWETTEYIRGHECEHRRSTASVPYANGIQLGMHVVIRYIASQLEKRPRMFRTQADYDAYVQKDLPAKGVWLSLSDLKSYVRFIANALEDGRIERIRSERLPGYALLRTKYRGRFWSNDKEKLIPYDELNAVVKLKVILNQILTLATCQIYQKGFINAYMETPLFDAVNKLKPAIGKAFIARRTRQMADQVVVIAEQLAPYIFEACKMANRDVKMQQMLKDMLSAIARRLIEQNGENPGGDLTEQEEMEDERKGMPKSTFPNSDLTIILPDEEYDALMKNAKKSGEGEGGINIQREHPKDEGSDEDQSDGDGASQNESNSQKNSNQQSQSQSKKPDENEGSNGKEEQNAEKNAEGTGNSNSENNKPDDETEEGKGTSKSEETDAEEGEDLQGAGNGTQDADDSESGDSQGTDGSENSNDTGSCNDNSQSGSEQMSGSQSDESQSQNSKNGTTDSDQNLGKGAEKISQRTDEIEKSIEAAMKEAAEHTKADAEMVLDDIDSFNVYEKRTMKKNTTEEDQTDPHTEKEMRKMITDTFVLSDKEIKEMMKQSFVEEKRKYKVSEHLPAVIAARGKAMFKQNQKYFKGLSKPTIKNLDSGSIDPSRITGLAYGDTEIFQRLGKDKKFDGAAYMLVDNSGSMSGRKKKEASKAAAVVEEGFKKMFPMKIVAFDTWGTITHEVIKNWDEWLPYNCCWNYALKSRDGGGNEDGYDIMIATKELLERPEKKKMLVVLSDGAPGNRDLVKKAVRTARKKGIEVYSIYFEEGGVSPYAYEQFEYMYEKDFVVCPLSELDQRLYRLFKKFSRS